MLSPYPQARAKVLEAEIKEEKKKQAREKRQQAKVSRPIFVLPFSFC